MTARSIPVFLLICAISALAYLDVILQPEADVGKDSYTYRGHGNFGDSSELYLEYEVLRPYLEFVELEDYIGEGLTLLSTKLEIFVYESPHEPSNMPSPMLIAPAAEDWEEMEITWDNQPDPLSEYEMEAWTSDIIEEHWETFYVTEIVAVWLDETIPNYGFVMYDYLGEPLCFASSDASSRRPKLTLTLNSPAVEEASWGAIKAGF
ncbi:MAG TPA: DNRLRE domain-containing protein [bacterium]|nr:DNRLRE domain-containing protein [bacterium]